MTTLLSILNIQDPTRDTLEKHSSNLSNTVLQPGTKNSHFGLIHKLWYEPEGLTSWIYSITACFKLLLVRQAVLVSTAYIMFCEILNIHYNLVVKEGQQRALEMIAQIHSKVDH